MATATAPAAPAPTEAEIRAAIEADMAAYPNDNEESRLREAIDRMADSLNWHRDLDPVEDEVFEYGNNIWTDLRPSQAQRLAELREAAQERGYQSAREAILDELVAAALAFGAEYPDAPRSTREAVTA